jgi:ATP-dependent helicase HrpB
LRFPIDPLSPEILNHLRTANNLVLEAPPGAGKTTRVPPALLRPRVGTVSARMTITSSDTLPAASKLEFLL